MKRLRFTKRTTTLLLLTAIVSLVAMMLVAYSIKRHRQAETALHAGQAKSSINYGPPTATEKQDAQTNKEHALAEQRATEHAAGNPDTIKQVTPTITSASQDGSQVTVKAFVAGIF